MSSDEKQKPLIKKLGILGLLPVIFVIIFVVSTIIFSFIVEEAYRKQDFEVPLIGTPEIDFLYMFSLEPSFFAFIFFLSFCVTVLVYLAYRALISYKSRSKVEADEEELEKERIKLGESGLTRRSLLITVTILLIWGLISIFAGNFGQAPHIYIGEMSILFPFFLLIFGLHILEKIRLRGTRLSRQELTFIWAMMIVGIPITNSGFIAGRLLLNAMYTHQEETLSMPKWSPFFWAPSLNEINRAYLLSDTFPDIIGWIIPLIFWAITAIAWAFMSLFLIQIFRKPWVDVERLAFPLAQPVQELLEAPLALPEERRTRYFWLALGSLLAIFWTSLEFLRVMYPEWGDILKDVTIFGAIPGGVWDQLAIDFGGSPFNLSATFPNAYLVAYIEPVMVAAFTLVSLNVLLSGLVFYALFWVLIPVFETEAGIIEPPAYIGSPPWQWEGFASFGGISLFVFGEFGMLFGVVIWAIILQRRYLWRTIKAIWDPSIIDESGEPISYRTAWIGMLVSAFIFFLSLFISGSPLSAAIYTVVFLAVGYLAGARLRAETAGMGIGHPGYLHLHGMHTARLLWGEKGAKNSGFYVTSIWMQFFQRDAAPASPAISSLEAYNIARITKTRTRDIFIAQGIGVVAIILFCLIIWPIFAYFYGLTGEWDAEVGANFHYSDSTLELAVGSFWDHKSYDIDIWGQVIMGMVFAIGLNILRLTRPWLPLNPIAAPLLLSMQGPYWWLPMLIAYIIKFMTVRIGGTKAYTNYLLPAAVGYLIGAAGIWGYTLVCIMIPTLFPFLFFDRLILDFYYNVLVLGIWIISIIVIILYLVRGLLRK